MTELEADLQNKVEQLDQNVAVLLEQHNAAIVRIAKLEESTKVLGAAHNSLVRFVGESLGAARD